MDLLTLISRGVVPIIDFKSMKGDVKPFMAKYGGHINSIGIVVKDETGRGYFDNSAAPPASPDHAKFLRSSAELFQSLEIKVYAIVDAFLDSRAIREPRRRSIDRFGKQSERFSCPSNVSNQNDLAKLVEELASTKLVDNIVVTDSGFVRRDYCFCDSCQKEFAQRNKLPLPVTSNSLASKQGMYDDWIKWRSEVVTRVLDQASKRVAEVSSKTQREIAFYGAVDVDERTGYFDGATRDFGQKAEDIMKSSNLAVRIQPWTPIIPSNDTPEYSRTINALKTVSNLLSDNNRKGLILVWNIETEEDLATTKDMEKALSASGVLSFLGYPQSIGPQRDAHLGLDLEAK
ncbi:MAG: hypothetical protein WED05_00360 [Candidatus Atabeyarchaeum deiterrae]